MKMLKCLIVDDEHLARTLLDDYVSKVPFLEKVGACKNAMEAMAFLQNSHVDIMFLDINMPGFTGIEMLRTIQNPPLVIFTTAYSQYAVESYELDAVDYLLKPIKLGRFMQAVNKAAEIMKKNEETEISEPKQSDVQSIRKDYLTVKADHKIYKINFRDLIYVEGMREYVTFHTTSKKIVALASLKALEESLPEDLFIRIHKSYITSVTAIDSLEGNQVEVAAKMLPVGKSYKDNVLKIFTD